MDGMRHKGGRGDEAPDEDALDPGVLSDDPVVQEARKRFDRCNEWEGEWRQRFLRDIKFAYGDSENGFQWPNAIRNARENTARPCLTMNLIRAHNKMISNEMRKNKSEVKFIGMGNGATQDSANVMQDLFRHTQQISDAQHLALPVARSWAVDGGVGYFRLVTRYEADDSFNQEVYIDPVDDPMQVFLDPDIHVGGNALDGKFAFVFDDVPRQDFRDAYPDLVARMKGTEPLGLGGSPGDRRGESHIRVCEYFRKVPKRSELVSFLHEGQRFNFPRDRFERLVRKKEARDGILDRETTRLREVTSNEVEWYLIVGSEVIEKTIWLGKYIPMLRVIGEETVIEGRLDRKGHTRYMLDAQRMFNYFSSAQIEGLALQTKAPWLAPAKAIEEHEAVWRMSNIDNPAVLPYNHVDPEGNPEVPIPPPQRIDPPQASPGFQQAMENSRQQIMMVSGQYENQMGEPGNERTGAAINARRSQSATANFHFQDNYEGALIALGKQLLDLYPRLYDTKRIKRIVASDGMEYDLVIDPSLRAGFVEEQNFQGEVIKRVMNPMVGKYEVGATVGPSHDTRREETVENMTLLLTQAPGLISILGDVLLKNMQFEGAQEAALRLRRMIPPVALGKGPTQQEQALQQQLAAMQQALVKEMDLHARDRIKLNNKDDLREVEVYDAETKRIAALSKLLPTDPEGLQALIAQAVQDSLKTSIGGIMDEIKVQAGSDGSAPEPVPEPPPIPGASKAPDGEWYLTDPTRKGKYLRVAPLAQLHSVPGQNLRTP
jgi:Phage P22-like portal protein